MSADSTLRGYGLSPQTPPSRRKKRRGLELVFILGFVACLLLGALALGLLFWFSGDEERSTDRAPMSLLRPTGVVVGLATRRLAGDSVTALVSQALQANELDTAAALLLFDADSTPSARAALWQQLARRWFELGAEDESARSYAQTVNFGVLDVALRTLERSQLLTQAAAGLSATDPEAATVAAEQAKRVIAQAPDLLPAQRSQLLQPLKLVVEELSAPALLAQVDDLLRNPYLQPGGVLLASSWAAMMVRPAPDAAVEAARATRELAARNLAERYVLTGGVDTDPEVQALAAALVAEDQARGNAFRAALDAATNRQQQLGVLLEQERWMLLKLQVAHQAFGIPLVPAWETALPALEGELSGLVANTMVVLDALAEAQPTPLEQNLLRAESAWWLALQSEIGHAPGSNAGEIGERLRLAQSELARVGSPLALPVAWEPSGALPGFHIQAR